MIPSNILKDQFNALVEYEMEKINIAESIKMIKENLKDEGMEKEDIAALHKVASAKAKENLEALESNADKIKEILALVA